MDAIIISSLIFIICLVLIFSEKINRTIIAIIGAIIMVTAGILLGFFSQEDVLATIDFTTLGLLLGMMVLVALLEPTGFFQYLAVYVGKLSKGNPYILLGLLGGVSTIVSMFLNNVTTVVLIAPVTILICEIIGVNSTPYLMAEAILSNTGGVATLVGDPPNILIASAAHFTFNDFLLKSLPVVVVTFIVVLLLLIRLFKPSLDKSSNCDLEALNQLDPSEALVDRRNAVRTLIVIAIAIMGFLMEEKLGLSPSYIALAAGGIGLAWVQPDIKETLKTVDWDILCFFTGLFVMVGALEAAGVLSILSDIIINWVHLPIIILGIITLWIVALLSAIVDNVPITIALIPVLNSLEQSGIDIKPLWWALVFGAGFGGNGTVIGSTANIVIAAVSEKTRTPITPRVWSKIGLPVMITSCVVSSLLYVIVYYLIGF